MTAAGVDLPAIRAAAERIEGRLRRTPMIRAAALRDPPGPGELWLKLENLQVTGSFKPRGATNCLLQLAPAEVERGVITASGGNHGLAVAYVGRRAETRAVIYLAEGTPREKVEKLAAWGAEVRIEGRVWDEANRAALVEAERDGLTYIHPFADPRVIAGQGTLGLEMLEQAPQLDVLLVAIGGGGLISGIATAAKALKPEIRIIGVEAEGAPTLTRALAAGAPVSLAEITTAAGTLAPARTAEINLAIIAEKIERIVLVSDAEMRAAARWLWFELGIAAELAGAAALAALQQDRIEVDEDTRIGVLVCGAGRDGLD